MFCCDLMQCITPACSDIFFKSTMVPTLCNFCVLVDKINFITGECMRTTSKERNTVVSHAHHNDHHLKVIFSYKYVQHIKQRYESNPV